jgi:hypothetical protein
MSLLTERWHKNPRTSHAYQMALREPPSGKHHPTFQPTRQKPRPNANVNEPPAQPGQEDRQDKVKFSRLTHSTLYRSITGHAFTGEYTQ